MGDTKHKFLYAKATMQVPLNWADVTGKKISLTVVRIRSVKQKNRIGSLLINPGGPGESGIDYAIPAALEELPAAILDRFDIIGFDPRGIGLSSPIQCITNKQKDAELNLPADPTTDAQWQESIADVTTIANECYTEYGSDLTYYSTAETARDVEALRAKLGDSKLTFLGLFLWHLDGRRVCDGVPDQGARDGSRRRCRPDDLADRPGQDPVSRIPVGVQPLRGELHGERQELPARDPTRSSSC